MRNYFALPFGRGLSRVGAFLIEASPSSATARSSHRTSEATQNMIGNVL
jgi:hypothetical protein